MIVSEKRLSSVRLDVFDALGCCAGWFSRGCTLRATSLFAGGRHCGAGCVAELPDFNKLQENYLDDVVVVAVHGTVFEASYDGTEGVQRYIDEKNWNDYALTFVQDSDDLELKYSKTDDEGNVTVETKIGQMYKSLGGKGAWPTTVILDTEGKIVEVHQNTISYEKLEGKILPLINK